MMKNAYETPCGTALEPLRKGISALISFLCGYALILILTTEEGIRALLIPLLAVFVLWGLTALGKRTRSPGHLLWLFGCVAVALRLLGESTELPFSKGFVWGGSVLPALSAPVFAAMWILSLSGLRFSAGNGRLLPFDLWQGLILLPLRGYSARFRQLESMLSRVQEKHGPEGKKKLLLGLLVTMIALVFLTVAFLLLCGADDRFSEIAEQAIRAFSFLPKGSFFVRALLSILPGGMMFALIENAKECSAEEEAIRANAFLEGQKHLRRLPASVWGVMLSLFAAMYTVFFILQGQELLEAARANLAPGTLTMAEYAKQGFFEMCGVMALNFLLMLVCALTGDRPVRRYGFTRALFAVILLENTLFAVLAALKLVLYVRSFGFTPLRMQGAFGILCLSLGCVCALVWLFTGKRASKTFILLSAALFAVTLLL